MAGSVTWSFTTAASAPGAPTVTTDSPAAGATGVSNVPTITATFNEPVQPGTVTFTLKNSSGTAIPSTLSYNSAADTVALSPNSILAYRRPTPRPSAVRRNAEWARHVGAGHVVVHHGGRSGLCTERLPGEYIETDQNTIPNFGYNPTVTSIASGFWSSPSTWSTGQVPGAGAIVSIASGDTVTYDADSTTVLGAIDIQTGGTLQFATNVNTEVIAGRYLVLPGGTLDVGTQANPIASNVTATIETANQALNTTFDPEQYGESLIGLGNVTIYGAEKTPYVQLAVAPQAGDTTLTCRARPPAGRSATSCTSPTAASSIGA